VNSAVYYLNIHIQLAALFVILY